MVGVEFRGPRTLRHAEKVKAVGVAVDDVERLLADRAGRAEHHDVDRSTQGPPQIHGEASEFVGLPIKGCGTSSRRRKRGSGETGSSRGGGAVPPAPGSRATEP